MYLQNRNRLTDLERMSLLLLGGGGKVCKGGRVSKGCWAFGVHMYTLLCLK